MYLAVDTHGMLVKTLVTPGVTTDCVQVRYLIEEVSADYLLADRGYDSNAIIDLAKKQKMEIVIPPKKDRKIKTSNDKALYELRHLVGNAFLHLKRWRDVATRYAKNTASFLAAVQIRCIALWRVSRDYDVWDVAHIFLKIFFH
ncbi:IS5/IS1182 family transposase [Nitrosomonas sp. GH22]|nr:IS5/IS1182 family transposase [Nitrosomonas sp. GH22]